MGKTTPKPTIRLKIRGFGPLPECQIDLSSSNAVFGVYAANGSGKTFISRAFRLLDTSRSEIPQDRLDNLIFDDENEAYLEFSIKSEEAARYVSVSLPRGQSPTIKQDPELIFHVFNQDYIRENLERRKYSPDGNIQGFVVGKANVDLKRERTVLAETKALTTAIEDKIKSARQELLNAHVQPHMTEYQTLDLNNVLKPGVIDGVPDYQEVQRQLRALESIPDEQPPLSECDTSQSPESVLSAIEKTLQETVSRSQVADSVARHVDSHPDFIRLGLDHYKPKDEKCPFCQQKLEDAARKLIETYELYVTQAEGKLKKKCAALRQQLDEWRISGESLNTKAGELRQAAELRNSWLPTAERVRLPEHSDETQQLDASIVAIDRYLQIKGEDVTRSDFDLQRPAAVLHEFFRQIADNVSRLNISVRQINDKTERSKQLIRNLRRDLCNARLAVLKTEVQNVVAEREKKEQVAHRLEDEITAAEERTRAPKRKLVAESFKHLVREFFGDRFVFEPEDFVLSFRGKPVSDRHETVLSEGEQRIVAFCFYLAEIHTKVTREDDYGKLLFVIDDPVSSLDYGHMYRIANRISKPADRVTRLRLIVLTHSSTFQGLLVRQRLCERWYTIRRQGLEKVNQGILLPYDEHLRQIVKVAEGCVEEVDHGTPNSVRHVLENIASFEDPGGSFDKWLQRKGLHKSHLFRIVNDLSHGRTRSDDLHSHEEIVSACKEAVQWIEINYEYQLNHAKT